MELDSIYTDLIMEHSQSIHNRRKLDHVHCSERGHNPSCGDDITLELELDGGRIKEAAFTGSGCAISQASTSMMIDLIRNKPIEEVLGIADLFISMIKRKNINEDELEALEDAVAFKNISNMPARVKCAVLSWHTLKEAMKGSGKNQ